MIILIGLKPEMVIYAKVKDYDKVTASDQTWFTWGILVVKRPPILKHRNNGIQSCYGEQWLLSSMYHSHTFTIFHSFYKDPWSHAIGRPPLNLIKFEHVPIYLEFSFILFTIFFFLFLMLILKAKNFKKFF